MSVNSAGFLLFLAAGVVLYYAVPKKVRYLVLLAASVCFYLFYSVKAAVYLLVTVVLTYVCGLGLGALRGKEEKEAYLIVDKEERRALKRSFRRRRRLLLGLVLALNFATLALFKYLGSWIIGVNRIFGTSFRPLKLLLPLGISFYIFQTAGYLIDVYRGRQKCEKNFLKYTLFAIYFPQMIQGPINRFGSLADDLFGGSSFNADNIRFGIQLMLWGMLKKAFIADTLSVAVGEIYTNFTEYPGASVVLHVLLDILEKAAERIVQLAVHPGDDGVVIGLPSQVDPVIRVPFVDLLQGLLHPAQVRTCDFFQAVSRCIRQLLHNGEQLICVFDVVVVCNSHVIGRHESDVLRRLQPVAPECLLCGFFAIIGQRDAPGVLRQLLQIKIVAFACSQNQKRCSRSSVLCNEIRQFCPIFSPVIEFVIPGRPLQEAPIDLLDPGHCKAGFLHG